MNAELDLVVVFGEFFWVADEEMTTRESGRVGATHARSARVEMRWQGEGSLVVELVVATKDSEVAKSVPLSGRLRILNAQKYDMGNKNVSS